MPLQGVSMGKRNRRLRNNQLTFELGAGIWESPAGGVPPAGFNTQGPEGPYLPAVTAFGLHISGGYDGPVPEELWAAWLDEAETELRVVQPGSDLAQYEDDDGHY